MSTTGSCAATGQTPSIPELAASPWGTSSDWPEHWRKSSERKRMTVALLLSLLVHALLLSLTFGGLGIGLPGFGFPWQDRRIEVPQLNILLAPAPSFAAEPATEPEPIVEPLPSTPVAQPVGGRSALRSFEPLLPGPEPTAQANVTDTAPTPFIEAAPMATVPELALPPVQGVAVSANEPITPNLLKLPAEVALPAPAVPDELQQESTQLMVERKEAARPEATRQEAAQQEAARQAVAQAEAARLEIENQEAAWQELARQEAVQSEATQPEAAQQELARAEVKRLESDRQQAASQAAAQVEAAQMELERQETARHKAAEVEAARQLEAEHQAAQQRALAQLDAERRQAARAEAALRIEAERLEAARLDAERETAAQQVLAKQEAARLEALRQAAAQQEEDRRQAAQAEASKMEAERLEGERQAAAHQAAQQEASRQQAAQAAQAEAELAQAERQEAEAQRQERLRAIGRQLNEEADRRDAAAAAAKQLPYSLSTARRVRLFGRSDPNTDLILYAEAWARKIQMNMTIDQVREAARQPHTQPVVTVAIRSDGTVESVTIVRSSGVAAIDEAVERIVRSQANYPAFSPALARQYDVVEIRRTWHFDMAVRLE